MIYVKPALYSLDSATRASGSRQPACISGTAAGGDGETCMMGNGAPWACESGSSGYEFGHPCSPGTTPGGGDDDCIEGGSPAYCISGASGTLDPNTCRFGPSN